MSSSTKNKTRKRKPKGVSTGGQFAPENLGIKAPTAATVLNDAPTIEAMSKAPIGSPLAQAYIAYQKATSIPAGVALRAFTGDKLNWVSPVAKALIAEVEKEPIFKVEILTAGLKNAVSEGAAKGFALLNELKVKVVNTYSADNYAENNGWSITINRPNYDPLVFSKITSAMNSIWENDGPRFLAKSPSLMQEIFSPEEIACVKEFANCWWKTPIYQES